MEQIGPRDAPQRTDRRNFCIVAHIDHGKSTLADRLIERAHIVRERDFQDQLLDTMDIERERGISIKSCAIAIPYQQYTLNLVDTPGHADFAYEVSRAIASCEGALLLIDAAQGIQAQTVANFYLALEHDLEIIPVINKIDLPSARVEEVRQQISSELGLDGENAPAISAKLGSGIDDLLTVIVDRIPPPSGDQKKPLRARIFDSHYDAYRGVIAHVRLVDGTLRAGDEVRTFSSDEIYRIEEVGCFRIGLEKGDQLLAGDVGYLVAGIKNIGDIAVGDTVTHKDYPCDQPLAGFHELKPVVFSSIYPVDANDYGELVRAIQRLKLNDAALSYDKESSQSLGYGFRCGFLGLLHIEITQERLEREFDLDVVLTLPSVRYEISKADGVEIAIHSPHEYPDLTRIDETREPYIRASIISPSDSMGALMQLCTEKRGQQQAMHWLDEKRVELVYLMPLAEILFDFYDRLKSLSHGYASFDYEPDEYRPVDLVRLDILVNGIVVDALSQLLCRDHAVARARIICQRLHGRIPRHQFKIPIQGSVGGQIVARETLSAYRKDVIAKCYGGDISRKRKLLSKQKAGKRRLRMVGNVTIPQNAFLAVLRSTDD